jgi:glycosyltransferase involved in cell wall biosynthesis
LHGDAERPLGQAEVDRVDAWCAAANPGQRVTIPTGIGFCLFLRHDCLADTGPLREDVFAQGYGEENDWCLRAGDRGWRHVAEAGMFVAHAGGRSFGHARPLLMARNAPLLDRLHPQYRQAVRDFLRADPLRHCKRRVAAACWEAGRSPGGAAILVTHDFGGGTEQRIVRRCADLARQGLRPIVLRLGVLPTRQDAHRCTVSAGHATAPPDRAADLRFDLPGELAELCALLRGDRPHWLELHHCGGLPPDILDLSRVLGIPYDVAVHDYAMLCPRVTFCGVDGRYCGEPADIGQCDACVATAGSRLHEAIGVAALRARSARILKEARQVLVSCDDVARRLRRYVPGLTPVVTPWEPDFSRPPRPPLARPMTAAVAETRETRICVVGALGRDKGYDVLLHCAQDAAARDLALRFMVVGHTIDDARLLATGRVFVTGRFAEDEAEALVRDQAASLGFLPSVCPETWSFALSTLWRAGLPVLSFALGAPAERIRQAGRGWTMPLGAPAAQVNAVLLDLAARPRRDAPVPHAAAPRGVAHVASIGHASGRAAPAQEVRI